MATKGYNSYHGRMSGGKIALIVALALVLVGAVAYLTLQNYVVYDEAGNARLELPFLHRKDKEEPDDTPSAGDRDDIVDTVEPEHPHVKVAALHGVRLPDDCLWWGADYIMNTLAPEDMVLAVKRTTGGITYGTSVETPAGVGVETGRPIDCLKTLLASGRYTVGSVVCFRDSAYSRSVSETALVREDTGWTKNTIITMLSRLEAKGAVRYEEGGRAKQYFPTVDREDAARTETESFLDKVYGGSLGLMMSAMVDSHALTEADITELSAILSKLPQLVHYQPKPAPLDEGHQHFDLVS